MAMQHASDWDRDAALTTARILLEIKAVNFRPEEPYIFTSGWKTPGLYRLPQDHLLPARAHQDLRPRRSRRSAGISATRSIDAVAGGETAGIPFAAWIADRMAAPMAYVRKKPKGFGRNAQIEGDVPEGKRTLLVEDLTTDGAVQDPLRPGAARRRRDRRPHLRGVLLRRLPRQLRDDEGHGPNLHHLCTWWDVLEVCRERPYFAERALKEVRQFLEDPVAWSKAHGGIGSAASRGAKGAE